MQLSTTTGICCPELWRRQMSREGDERRVLRVRRREQIEMQRKRATKKITARTGMCKDRYNTKKTVTKQRKRDTRANE